MKVVYTLAGAGVVVGGLHAGGVLETGQLYPKPFDQAYAELSAMPVPAAALGATGGTELTIRRLPDSIEWHFQRHGEDVYIFSAHLTAKDNYHTRVKVGFEVGDALDDQSRRLIGSDYMRSTARLALNEQLAAELEDRTFDQMRLGSALASRAQAHPEELKAFGNDIRQMMIDNAEIIRGNAGPSSGGQPPQLDQQISTRRSMDEATRPMTVLPGN